MRASLYDTPLTRLQRWMQVVITAPGGVEDGLASGAAQEAIGKRSVQDVVRDLPGLEAHETLAVYAQMYAERMLEALTLDYPAARHALGPETFKGIARDFVASHPSREKTLNRYGHDFAAWLATRDLPATEDAFVPAARVAFVAELARLERAIVDVRTAPDSDPLELDALLAVPPEAWPGLRLQLAEAVVLLATDYPVEPYYRAWRREQDPALPEPRRSFAAVYRHDLRVWRIELGLEAHALLSALAAGQPLGAAIEIADTVAGAQPDLVSRDLEGWFQEWSREGFFRALEGPAV